MEFLKHVLYIAVALGIGAGLWHWRVQVKAAAERLAARLDI